MERGRDANVAQRLTNLHKGDNRINFVCCCNSAEDAKCCHPNAISSTRKQQSQKGCFGGRSREAPGGGERQRWRRALAPSLPSPTISSISINKEGRSLASRLSSLNSVILFAVFFGVSVAFFGLFGIFLSFCFGLCLVFMPRFQRFSAFLVFLLLLSGVFEENDTTFLICEPHIEK